MRGSRRTVTFVGQSPGKCNPMGVPFGGKSGKRLATFCKMDHESWIAATNRINVLEDWPGKAKKGDVFKVKAGSAADKILNATKVDETIVLCGRAVATACGVDGQFLKWMNWNGRRAVIIPHPSGINLWYNDRCNRDALEKLLLEVMACAGSSAGSDR